MFPQLEKKSYENDRQAPTIEKIIHTIVTDTIVLFALCKNIMAGLVWLLMKESSNE